MVTEWSQRRGSYHALTVSSSLFSVFTLVLVLYSLMYVLELNLTALQNGLKKTLQQYTRYQKQFSSHPDSQCLWFWHLPTLLVICLSSKILEPHLDTSITASINTDHGEFFKYFFTQLWSILLKGNLKSTIHPKLTLPILEFLIPVSRTETTLNFMLSLKSKVDLNRLCHFH